MPYEYQAWHIPGKDQDDLAMHIDRALIAASQENWEIIQIMPMAFKPIPKEREYTMGMPGPLTLDCFATVSVQILLKRLVSVAP